MAIKELITLEGVEDIEAKLARLKQAGEDSLGQFRDLGKGDTANPFDTLVQNAQQAGLHLDEVTTHSKLLSEAFHVLRPAMQAAGIQFTEFGSLARLASTSLVGLGAAIIAAGAIGLGKLEEQTAGVKARLTDLIGSTTAGEAAFGRIEQSAKAFGTTVAALEPSFVALKRGLDDFAQSSQGFKFVAFNPADLPGAQDLDKITKATDNFFKILRAGRLDSADAAKASEAFFAAVAAGGNLTADILKKLPVGTIQLLAQAMGRGIISVSQFTAEVAKTPIPINKLTEALDRFGPQSDQAFDSKAIITMGDALTKLLDTFSNFAKSVSGLTISEGIVQQIELFRKGFEQTVAQIDAFIKKAKEAGDIKIFGVTLVAFDDAAAKKDAEKTGLESAEAFKKGFRTAPKGDPVKVEDIVTITAGSAADVIIGQFKEHFQAAAPATWEPLTKVPPFQLSDALASFKTGMDSVVGFAQAAYQQITTIFSQPIPVNVQFHSPGAPSLQSTEPFAGGGMVRGRGTTTSDSILAWLSNKEYVVNARAVSHYGPDLFAALNSMRLPRDFIGGFSMGGLARAISGNRFAAGGQVGAGHPVVLNIDRHSFNMSAGGDTIAQLKRFAVTSQLSSTGRKPRWVK